MKTLPEVPITPRIEELFWSHVQKGEGDNACWEWIGQCWKLKGKKRYGVFRLKADGKWKRYKAHRVAYAIQYGTWPKHFACHTYDNEHCVRGDHLFDGTPLDNMRDMQAKGRAATGDRNGMNLHPESRRRGVLHHAHKLTDAQVMEIRQRCRPGSRRGDSMKALGREFGVSDFCIYTIVNRFGWTHLD